MAGPDARYFLQFVAPIPMKKNMVLKDPFSNASNQTNLRGLKQSMQFVPSSISAPSSQLAPPSDRVLASFFDFLFHIPFFSLASFIILYRLNLLKLTVAATSELMAVVAQLVWVVFIGSIVLNSIYLKFWKKTPGMRIMKLELHSLNRSSLTWEQCLLRSGAWAVEILMFGIPLLVILSHQRRQAFHDRISETEVISLKSYGGALSPLPAEKTLVSVVVMALLMLGLGWMTAFFSLTQKGIQNGTMALSEWRSQGQLCSQVDEISTYSNISLTELSQRLDFSIALFLLEQIDSQCLNKEIEFAFYKKVSSSLVWVGRALLSPLYTEERAGYLSKACSSDSRWCAKSLLHEKGPLNEATALLKSEKAIGPAAETLSYTAAKLIIFNRLGENVISQKLIQKLQSRGIRATGLVAEQLKVISRDRPGELTSALSTLKSVMVEKDFLRLNAELCVRQLETGCASKINECEMMNSLISEYKDESLNDLMIGRAVFKDAICKDTVAANIEYWTLIGNKGLQKLIQIAMEISDDTRHAQALMRLRNFVKDQSEVEDLRLDALQLLMQKSNFQKDWLLVSQLWSELHWTQKIYLSATEWIMREAQKNRQNSIMESLENIAFKVPGLKLSWELIKSQRSLQSQKVQPSQISQQLSQPRLRAASSVGVATPAGNETPSPVRMGIDLHREPASVTNATSEAEAAKLKRDPELQQEQKTKKEIEK